MDAPSPAGSRSRAAGTRFHRDAPAVDVVVDVVADAVVDVAPTVLAEAGSGVVLGAVLAVRSRMTPMLVEGALVDGSLHAAAISAHSADMTSTRVVVGGRRGMSRL